MTATDTPAHLRTRSSIQMPYHWAGMERDVEETTVDRAVRAIHANRMKRDPRKRPPLLHMNLSHLPHNREDTSQESQHAIRNLPCPSPLTEWDMYYGLQQQQTKTPATDQWTCKMQHEHAHITPGDKSQHQQQIYSNLGIMTTTNIPRDDHHRYSIDAHHNQWQPKHQRTL